ncbi:MAG: hypothetical protein WKF84_09760 [Pyrinomonadaceae bacterium]
MIRQLLTESVLMSIIGGLLGLLLGTWGVELLVGLNGSKIPRAFEIGLDLKVIVFTFGISLLTGVLFRSGASPTVFQGEPPRHA